MKQNTFKLLFCLSLLLCSAPVFAAANLAPNPSFESTGTWGNWKYSGTAVLNPHDSTEALFGNYSASIGDCTGQVIINKDGNPISPANDYVYSGWIKTEFETLELKAALRLIWFTGSAFINSVEVGEVKGTSDWTFVYVKIASSQIPKAADRVTIACMVSGGTSTSKGTAYFDGLCLSAVSALERPAAPELSSDHLDGTVALSWTAPPGAADYWLYEGEDALFVPQYAAFFRKTTERQYGFTDQLRRGKYFRVAAVGANFVPSLFSDAVKGDRIAPLQVTELAADGSQTGVAVLRWRSPAAAPDGDLPTEYCIYKLTRPQLSHEYVAETAIFTLGEDGFSNVPGDVCEYWYPASGGQTYYYAVTARDSVGNESPPLVSDGCTPLADEVLPNAPEAVEAFSGTGPQQESLPEGLVLLRWREPQAASDGDLPRYYLLRRGDGSAASMRVIAQKKAQQPGGLLTFLDLTATAGCVYYYEIRSVDKARNESPAQAPLAARPQPPARAALLEPEDGFACLEAEGDERAQLLWSAALPAADEVSGYLVEYSLDSGFRQNVFSTRAYEARGENYGCDLPLAPLAAGTWFWRVKTEFASGVVSYSAIRRFGVVRKQQAAKEKGALSYVALEPKVLSGNAAATIYLALKIPASVSIRVFDSRGRLVKLIAQNEFRADVASWQWDGRDQAGRRLADGLYFVQIRAIAPPEPETTVLKRVQIFN